MDSKDGRRIEAIDIHHLDSSGTNFSFVTRLSVPVADVPIKNRFYSLPEFAFSSNGSKSAVAMAEGGVFVWDIRSKVPLWTFTEMGLWQLSQYPQFSSGILGKEILIFVEVCLMFTF